MPESSDASDAGTDQSSPDDGVSRRTLVRVLIAVAVGVPVVLEGLTFLGLVEHQLLGGGSGDDDGTGGTDTQTPSLVGVGDDLLPETPQAERLAEAVLSAGSQSWTLALTIDVRNEGEHPYRLSLDEVTTEAGTTVSGGAETRRLAPGERSTVAGRWELPAGETPRTVRVTAEAYPEAGDPVRTEKRVRLAKIPVRGG